MNVALKSNVYTFRKPDNGQPKRCLNRHNISIKLIDLKEVHHDQRSFVPHYPQEIQPL